MNQKGISLIEILVVLAISSIVGGVIIYSFVNMNRTVIYQNSVLDVQSEARNAMSFMVRVLREAGLDPLRIADAGVEEAAATKIRITKDANLNGLIEDGLQERISFSFNQADGTLSRGFDEGTPGEYWSNICGNVAAVSFSYLDKDGVDLGVPADLARVRTVNISLSLQNDKAGGGVFSRTLTTTVQSRNL